MRLAVFKKGVVQSRVSLGTHTGFFLIRDSLCTVCQVLHLRSSSIMHETFHHDVSGHSVLMGTKMFQLSPVHVDIETAVASSHPKKSVP